MNWPAATLLELLAGSEWANALRDDGRPAPIRLPADEAERAALVDAHVSGSPAELTFHARGREPWQERVRAVALAGFVPDAEGLVRWIAVDLDAPDHGASGLADPTHAMRCLASAADAAGLLGGLLAARSRGGRGRHCWLLLPSAVSREDGVLGVAWLVASADQLAARDVSDYGAAHAFRAGSGSIVRPGEPGGVELFPKSTERPSLGWALALPAAGAFRDCGGGVPVDSFTDEPCELSAVPRCDERHWRCVFREANEARPARKSQPKPRPIHRAHDNRDPLARIDQRTRDFLDGRIKQGGRNWSAFAAACNLLGCGVDAREVGALILQGAADCGLSESEARTCIASAVGSFRRRRSA